MAEDPNLDLPAEVDPLSDEILDVEIVEAETEFDLLFPVIDIAEDVESSAFPQPRQSVLTDDIAEFAEDERQEVLAPIETGDDFAFDWDSGQFYEESAGDPSRVTGDEAVVEWALKALNTERGEYPIYSQSYGSDLARLIGQPLPEGVVYAEITRTVKECLLQHPRIVNVEILQVRQHEDNLWVDIAMLLDNDDEPVVLEVSA